MSASVCRVDSGHSWLGTVPAHWSVRPLWSMFKRIKDVEHPDEQMLSVFRDHGVVVKDDFENLNKTAENRDIYQLVHPGWLVTNRMKAWQGSVGISAYRGIVSGHYICFKPTHGEDTRFLNWLLRSQVYTDGYALLSRGVRIGQAEIDNALYRTMPILLPPRPDQHAIADYLDRETAHTDAMIAQQRRLVTALSTRRTAAILDAVLGGEDPLGPSSAGSTFAALGFSYSVTLGKMLDAGKRPRPGDQELPYIRAANIQDGGLALEDVNTMPFSPSESRALDLRANDVVVVEGGAVGTSVVLREDMPGWSFQKTVNRLRVLRPAEPRFIAYVLLAYRDAGIIDLICNKSTIAHLTAEKLRALRVPTPSVAEQRRLADYLDDESGKIDNMIAAATDSISLMQERRTALITAAVTGRIDPYTGRDTTPKQQEQ